LEFHYHMDIIFRPARSEDVRQLCALLADLFSLESDFEPDPRKQASGLELLISDSSGNSLVLVAESRGEVLGMCSVQTLISTAEGGSVGLVEDVVVRKDRRKNGIGTRLLSEVLKWCEAKGLSRVHLLADMDNGNALRFYLNRRWIATNLICLRGPWTLD
jgi:GNAT superfamily N-acetyltransferase